MGLIGHPTPKAHDFLERSIAVEPVPDQVAPDNDACAPDPAPAVDVYDVAGVEGPVEGVEYGAKVFWRGHAYVADGHPLVNDPPVLWQQGVVWVQFAFLGKVEEVGDAGLQESFQLVAGYGRVEVAWVDAGKQAAWFDPIGPLDWGVHRSTLSRAAIGKARSRPAKRKAGRESPA